MPRSSAAGYFTEKPIHRKTSHRSLLRHPIPIPKRGTTNLPLSVERPNETSIESAIFISHPLCFSLIYPPLQKTTMVRRSASPRRHACLHESLSSAKGLVRRRQALRYVVTGLKTVTACEGGYPSMLMSSAEENTSEGSGLRR